uniref:SF3 helicase domain-containing protein n=1 Tax=viral metagenome TaxID=1070528 RepID=A0A6C0KNB6_9ZZZZ
MGSRTNMPPIIDNFLETPFGLFLDSHRVTEKGELCTFTGMGTMKGKFHVKDEEYTTFLDHLHEYLFTNHRRPLNLVEQRRSDLQTPILIDLDFKYSPEHALERQFEISHIHHFIEEYVQNITQFYKLDESKVLRFFVTLRPAPYEDKKSNTSHRSIKDGVHIQCPDLILSSEHQQVLRHRSLEYNNLAESFKDTGYINLDKDVFDEAIVKKNGWFFYGESKPDIPAYSLQSVYVYNPQSGTFYEEDGSTYTSRQLVELLSIRYHLPSHAITFHEESREEWQERLEYCTGKRSQLPSEEAAAPIEMPMVVSASNNVHEQLERDKQMVVKRLAVECLSVERATSYQSWMEVGWCLNSMDASEEMFQVWMDFSNKSGKSSENNVHALLRDWKRRWGHSRSDSTFTSRSLHMWAMYDNPKKYEEIMKDSFINFVESTVDSTHTHLARLMKRMYENTYCAAVDSKKIDWYQFTGTYWKKLPQGIELRSKLTTEVAQVIADTRTKIRERIMNVNDEQKTSWENSRLKKLFEVEKSLYQSGFKDSVMKDCIGLFYEEDFTQKLNSNEYLIGFNNGVIDLHAIRTKPDGTQEYYVNFRNAEPTDFITFMAGRYVTKNCDPIDYVEYNPNDPEQAPIHAEIDDFMTKVFPRPDLRAYMWRKLSSCLEGANKEQTYETWIGVGGNGKSKLVDLMSMALGDYATSLQSTVMTRKRPESGAANPDIMAIRNKRFIYMAEPDDREPLNTSRMKQFTGEDDVEARGLFEDQTKFKITGKIFMLCNAFPAINTMDRGTWRRVRAVPFESKFVEPLVEDIHPESHIYPRDSLLDLKMKKWRTLFMSRLVHTYKTEYLPHGLGHIPAVVTQESNKYQESFDSVAKFMNSRIREIKRGGYEANIKDIYRVYKNWYESIGGGVGKKLAQVELYKRLCDKSGEPSDRKTFKQMRLFEDDLDIEEYDRTLHEEKHSIN